MSSFGRRVGPGQAAVSKDRRAYEGGAPKVAIHGWSYSEANPVDPVLP
jgi:hypothetical protein